MNIYSKITPELEKEINQLLLRDRLVTNMLLKSEFSDYFTEVGKKYNITNSRHLLTVIRDGQIPKCYCGNPLGWKDTKYREYCSLKCSKRSQKVREKTRNTCIERYGVENPGQSPEIKERIKNTWLHNYGVDHPSKSPEIKARRIETWKLSYDKEDRDRKTKQTNNLKFGVDHPRQLHYSPETLEFLSNQELFTKLASEKSMEVLAKIYNISPYPIYSRMKELSLTPIRNQTSIFEKEVFEYIKSIYPSTVVENDRSVIHPKELDIYLPDLNLAIECNGTYWHSIDAGKDPGYHYQKTNLCNQKGIDLLYIWEHEWNLDRLEIKNKLVNLLTKSICEIPDVEELTISRSNNILLERSLRAKGYKSVEIHQPVPENIYDLTIYDSGMITYRL